MNNDTFDCPNCGAPLDYDGSGATTVRCPYCQSSVVVPETLRPRAERPRETVAVLRSTLVTEAGERKRGSSQGCVIAGVIVLTLLIIGMFTFFISSREASNSVSSIIAGQEQELGVVVTRVVETATAEPSATPEPSPTPAFMNPIAHFGEKGIGPGMLNDARYIAVDGEGQIYVGDYQGGRVQVYDSTGKYLRQKKVGDANTIFQGMAVDRAGNLFLAYDGGISKFDGGTGMPVATITNPQGGEYGDLKVTADGSLLAVWYEGRWGMITSLEGHREALMLYSPQGKLLKTLASPISGQTDALALDVFFTADGLGNLYALSAGEVFKFTPEGKYVNRWNVSDQLSSASAIAVDGQGRVYVGGSRTVLVFTPDGRPLADFPLTISADAMAFDDQGRLWVVSRDQVTALAPLSK